MTIHDIWQSNGTPRYVKGKFGTLQPKPATISLIATSDTQMPNNLLFRTFILRPEERKKQCKMLIKLLELG